VALRMSRRIEYLSPSIYGTEVTLMIHDYDYDYDYDYVCIDYSIPSYPRQGR
jgi:hypothetical protein